MRFRDWVKGLISEINLYIYQKANWASEFQSAPKSSFLTSTVSEGELNLFLPYLWMAFEHVRFKYVCDDGYEGGLR